MIDDGDAQAPRPRPGTFWAWEPARPHAATLVKVSRVRWNGDEWWVATIPAGAEDPLPGAHWNNLSRFWEACHHVAARAGVPQDEATTVRRGHPQPDELPGGQEQ